MNQIELNNLDNSRKGFREFCIYHSLQNKFINADFVPNDEVELVTTFQKRLNDRIKIINEPQSQGNEPKGNSLFVDEIPLGYTYDECLKYLAFLGDEKQFCSIVNVKEPLRSLHLQIKLVKISAKPIIEKHNQEIREKEIKRQRAEKAQREFDEMKKNQKAKFQSELKSWSSKGVGLFRNGITESQKDVYNSEKPHPSKYQLTQEDFTSQELADLAVSYNIHF